LIKRQWQWFVPFVGDIQQEDFVYMMGILNAEARFDAHPKVPSDEEMTIFDAASSRI